MNPFKVFFIWMLFGLLIGIVGLLLLGIPIIAIGPVMSLCGAVVHIALNATTHKMSRWLAGFCIATISMFVLLVLGGTLTVGIQEPNTVLIIFIMLLVVCTIVYSIVDTISQHAKLSSRKVD